LNWNDEHSVGVRFLDEEHLELFRIINDLHSAVLQGEERSRIGLLLRQVEEYTRSHFSSEEAILAATNYPERDLHSLKHQFLVGEVEALVDRFEQGGFMLNDQSLNFLRYWFQDHLQNDDSCYGPWLKAHGVE
jgi:hemerythrin-like metal-binding protein